MPYIKTFYSENASNLVLQKCNSILIAKVNGVLQPTETINPQGLLFSGFYPIPPVEWVQRRIVNSIFEETQKPIRKNKK